MKFDTADDNGRQWQTTAEARKAANRTQRITTCKATQSTDIFAPPPNIPDAYKAKTRSDYPMMKTWVPLKKNMI
jgi:hypothetical protein